MSTKKPNSPEPKQDLKSPKADAVVQDPKKQGNAKPNEKQPAAQEKKPEGKNDKDKGKPAEPEKGAKPKDAKPAPAKGKNEAHGGAFLTEAKLHDHPPPKPENVLVSSGLLEAYDYLQKQICKHGLPMGNAFEFAAITFLKYERKLKAKEADKRVEVTNKEKEKKVDVKEVDVRHGRSPRGHSEEAGKNVKSPQVQGKNQKEEEHKGGKGGKGDKSPPPKSPPPKEDEKGKGKGGKDDKERSKSPNPKDLKKDDHVINPKDQKDPKKGAVAEPDPKAAKKK